MEERSLCAPCVTDMQDQFCLDSHVVLLRNGAVSGVVRAALLLGQSEWGCPSPAALLMALGSSLDMFSVGENCS